VYFKIKSDVKFFLKGLILKTVKKCYRVEKDQIGFIKFIFEAYDGIAVISTLNSQESTIVFSIAPGCEDEVETIITDLSGEMLIEQIEIEQLKVDNIFENA